jgi:hypothetical protein
VVGKTFEIVCGDTRIVMDSKGTITLEAKEHIILKAKKIDMNP